MTHNNERSIKLKIGLLNLAETSSRCFTELLVMIRGGYFVVSEPISSSLAWPEKRSIVLEINGEHCLLISDDGQE